MSSFIGTEFYVMELGRLYAVEKRALTDQTVEVKAAENSQVAQTGELPDAIGPNGRPIQSNAIAETAPAADAAATNVAAKKSLDAHRLYFKALGSPTIIAAVFIFLFVGIAIDRASCKCSL